MDSPNIRHVPLNPEGALELGMRPCDACDMGWGSYSRDSTGKVLVKGCHEDCDYLRRYRPKIAKEPPDADD